MAEELSDIEADNQYLYLTDLSKTEDNTEEDSLVESLDDSRDSDLFYYNSDEEQSLNVHHTEKVNTQCTICSRWFQGISIYGYALHLESCSRE